MVSSGRIVNTERAPEGMSNPPGEEHTGSVDDTAAAEDAHTEDPHAAADETESTPDDAPEDDAAPEPADVATEDVVEDAAPTEHVSAEDVSAETVAINMRDVPPAEPDPVTEVIRRPEAPTPVDEPATEVFAKAAAPEPEPEPERRFTAPSSYDGFTEAILPAQEPATEIFAKSAAPAESETPQLTKTAVPQSIPPRGEPPKERRKRSWGWVVALLLVIAALVAVAILGTILLTRDNTPVVSEQDRVTDAIMNYDAAIKKGDLAMLRTITCGATRETYVNFDDRAWAEVHGRVAAAEEYPVIASVDQVVINGDHAEANVTTFMAKASSVRSTRSIDLQFRDEQWKVCQDAEG